ncbi:MAG TPA: 50S ribosomal protein L25 [Pirellulales bacterium]|jgi:large subunit ribosomal protein L25|nr:50S ribosomal protein L25 [Pirellulales bacterium]
MAEVLKVEKRKPHGKREARRLRAAGSVPANLYGHGEENVSLVLRADEVRAVVRHGARVVDLEGAVKEKAFIRDLQWDTYGTHVLHMDLTRVSADERLEIKIAVELRGTAAGTQQGGIVEQVIHDVDIECLATDIPEKLFLRIGDLQLDGSLTASAIELPPGVKLVSDPDELVVHCVHPAAETEAEPTAGAGAEPEVIGRKAEEGEEEES